MASGWSIPPCPSQPGESGGAGQEKGETFQGVVSAARSSVILQGRDVPGEVPEMWGTGWAQAGEGGAQGRGWERSATADVVDRLGWELQAHSRGLG